jgi:tRNA threonylcarbamoyladenosine biosynthesis protein TsaE
MEFLCKSVEETIAAGKTFGAELKAGDAVMFENSPMGTGKTYFTKGIALALGIEKEITSPTFALVNEYDCNGLTMFHFDLYRLGSSADLDSFGIDDYLRRCEKNGLAVFEWYDNARYLKNEFARVWFAEIETVGTTAENYRKIKIRLG